MVEGRGWAPKRGRFGVDGREFVTERDDCVAELIAIAQSSDAECKEATRKALDKYRLNLPKERDEIAVEFRKRTANEVTDRRNCILDYLVGSGGDD
jgi:hypothetical protein